MMRIDSLKNSPDRAGRYWVTFEDGTRLGLYRQTVEDFGLYIGKELTDEEKAQLLTAAGKMSAKMRAVRIVSASNVSKRDLEVQWMEDLHLVDDRNTAEQVVHSCISKGYGLARAKQALYEKRIPRQYWEEALENYPDQAERIENFLRTRLDEDSDQRQIKKAVDALLRRGHSYGIIKRVLNNLSFDSDDYIEDF